MPKKKYLTPPVRPARRHPPRPAQGSGPYRPVEIGIAADPLSFHPTHMGPTGPRCLAHSSQAGSNQDAQEAAQSVAWLLGNNISAATIARASGGVQARESGREWDPRGPASIVASKEPSLLCPPAGPIPTEQRAHPPRPSLLAVPMLSPCYACQRPGLNRLPPSPSASNHATSQPILTREAYTRGRPLGRVTIQSIMVARPRLHPSHPLPARRQKKARE